AVGAVGLSPLYFEVFAHQAVGLQDLDRTGELRVDGAARLIVRQVRDVGPNPLLERAVGSQENIHQGSFELVELLDATEQSIPGVVHAKRRLMLSVDSDGLPQ